ncbi:MAG: DnaJ domain-containing protein [Bacteroidota bacterium]|nr:DnaJ domain-containing protein [Bacteroidota bacterium]
MSIDNYYRILGIHKNASLEDIKKAFRAKAKILHPDKNKNPNAHENFILLNEANEYLQNLKTGKLYDQNKKTFTAHPREKQKTQEDWKNTERERSRARAQEYAKMKYAEFIKTDYYKSFVSLDTIASHLYFFFAITLVVIVPIVGTILYGIEGLGIGVLINLLTFPMSVEAIRDSPPLNLRKFYDSILIIVKTRIFLITSLTIINIILIMKIGLQTLLSPWLLLIAFCLGITFTYLIGGLKKDQDKFKIHFRALCIAPLLVNSILLINFIFSFNPVNETYHFKNDLQVARRGYQESSFIHLENDAYSEYLGIRTFLDYEEMRYKKNITYTFKKGILGLRVMTAYELSL